MPVDDRTMTSMVFLKPHTPLRYTLPRTRHGLPRRQIGFIERLATTEESEGFLTEVPKPYRLDALAENTVLQVGVKTDEDPDLTLTRFVREVRNTNVYTEVNARVTSEV